MPLMLTRKAGQSVILTTADGVVRVLVMKTTDDRARLEVDAPKAVRIYRNEVMETCTRKSSGTAS